MADEKPHHSVPAVLPFNVAWPVRPWIVLLLVIGSGLLLFSVWNRRTPEPLPANVTARDYQLAREGFEVKYGRRADRVDVLSYLAELQLSRDRLADAVACFEQVPTSHPQYGRMARFQQGRTLLTLHRAPEAEWQFREL